MAIPFLRTLILREVLASTSQEARALVTRGREALPLLVRALRQTAGRGRGSHTWWSDAGSLTFTIALDPRAHGLEPAQSPRVSLATAVALAEVLEPELGGVAVGIRWPNDLEVRGLKLGGILPELVQTPAGPRLLVGIGLNVTSALELAPAEVRAMATSVAAWTPRPLEQRDLDCLLERCVQAFATAIERLARGDPSLPERWNALDVLAGRQIQLIHGTEHLHGRGAGIDHEGGLRLWRDGETITLYGGQVARARPT